MNTKFKVIFLFTLLGIFITNFFVQHSSTLIAIYNLRRNVISININTANGNLSASDAKYGGDDDDESKKLEKIRSLKVSLENSESKVFSQNGEDGVLEKLIQIFAITSGPGSGGFFVEFGAGDGQETNTRLLRETQSWTGLMFDSSNHNKQLNLHAEQITHLNVISIFKKYRIDKRMIDVLSIDTDFADYWILERLLSGRVRPKVIIHEVNREPPEKCVSTAKLHGLAYWDNVSTYFGGSVCAYYCLARQFDYSMVYCEKSGVNCFWIRNDVLREAKFDVELLQKTLLPTVLFRDVSVKLQVTDRSWHYVDKCF